MPLPKGEVPLVRLNTYSAVAGLSKSMEHELERRKETQGDGKGMNAQGYRESAMEYIMNSNHRNNTLAQSNS